jgi:hypothetical protein
LRSYAGVYVAVSLVSENRPRKPRSYLGEGGMASLGHTCAFGRPRQRAAGCIPRAWPHWDTHVPSGMVSMK